MHGALWNWLCAIFADWRLPWAVAMHRKGRLAVARRVYLRILARAPRHFHVLQLLGLVALQRRRHAEALAWLERARALRPGDGMVWNHIGRVHKDLGAHELAEAHLSRACALAPRAFEPLYNLGGARAAQHDVPGARQAYAAAARLDPKRPEALLGLARLLLESHQLDAAIRAFDQVAERFPQARGPWFGKTLAVALSGDLAHANRLQRLDDEATRLGRRQMFSSRSGRAPWGRGFAQPEWQGRTPLAGRTLLLHAEAGFGDMIQNVRLVPLLARQGARVILEVPSPMLRPLADLPGLAQLVRRGAALPPHDLHLALDDLPIALDITEATIPPPATLSVGAELKARWAARLAPRRGRLRVGLACSGNPRHGNDRNRSMPLATLLQGIPDEVDLVCLQALVRTTDQATLDARPDLQSFAGRLTDFADTAALVQHMDLVVTVDTSIAHLAATLGTPTWILLSYMPDPRWMLDRDDSPWYPAARLFRQDDDWRWEPVLQRVREALVALAVSEGDERSAA